MRIVKQQDDKKMLMYNTLMGIKPEKNWRQNNRKEQNSPLGSYKDDHTIIKSTRKNTTKKLPLQDGKIDDSVL